MKFKFDKRTRGAIFVVNEKFLKRINSFEEIKAGDVIKTTILGRRWDYRVILKIKRGVASGYCVKKRGLNGDAIIDRYWKKENFILEKVSEEIASKLKVYYGLTANV